MLNTVMALWNQNPGENRPRIAKLLFTFLFISVSISLLLFTLNSSAWSPVTGKEQIQTKKEAQVGMSNHSGIATAGNTPASDSAIAGITPVATRTPAQACVRTSTVVVQPRAVPQNVVIYARNSGLDHKSSKPRHVRPKAVHVRKGKQHLSKRPQVKVIAIHAPQETVTVIPPSSSVPATPQPIGTPVVTASVTVTTVPVEGTVVSSGPDSVTNNATPDIAPTSTPSFAYSLRQKGAVHTLVPPAAKNTKKSDRVRKGVECSRSTTRKDDSEGTVLKEKRHAGLLVGGSLLGTLLLCCFVVAWRREEYSASLQHFKISSKKTLTTAHTYVIIPESSGETPHEPLR